MGKIYNYDTTSFIGGVAPEVQKHGKVKSTNHNKELDRHRKKAPTPAPKKK